MKHVVHRTTIFTRHIYSIVYPLSNVYSIRDDGTTHAWYVFFVWKYIGIAVTWPKIKWFAVWLCFLRVVQNGDVNTIWGLCVTFQSHATCFDVEWFHTVVWIRNALLLVWVNTFIECILTEGLDRSSAAIDMESENDRKRAGNYKTETLQQ